jgi:large subunit ribosomal protein L13
MKTTHCRAQDVEERWYVYDASQHHLGRMACEIAMRLMGKDRPSYSPSSLTGAHVVVVQAEKAVFTGAKDEQKSYRRYTGYAGGLRRRSLADLRAERPSEIVREAVRRMLPKNVLAKSMLGRLKVYAGATHPHSAQKPVLVTTLYR